MGDETQLLACDRLQQLGLAECDHSTDAMVHCEGSNTTVIGNSTLKCTHQYDTRLGFNKKSCTPEGVWLQYIVIRMGTICSRHHEWYFV